MIPKSAHIGFLSGFRPLNRSSMAISLWFNLHLSFPKVRTPKRNPEKRADKVSALVR
jgi:hypothetical protein